MEHLRLLGFEVTESREKLRELDLVVKDLMQKMAELEDLGIIVRDIDRGLIDFPAEKFGDKVFLCWKYGEPEIEYWHSVNEGFSRRKSLRTRVILP